MTYNTFSWVDFNDVVDVPLERQNDTEALRLALLDRLESVLFHLLPNGKVRGNKFYVGDIHGTSGKSLVVELAGPRCGLWVDFASNQGGDAIELWAQCQGLSTQRDFPALMHDIRQWLGFTTPTNHRISHHQSENKFMPLDELGPYTAKWDYLGTNGELIACVYRYDPPTGKEFRPWDVRARLWRAPDPRPLYNLPAVFTSSAVVFVEGEKCADALISVGIVATTAMHGAKAPVDKTDWTTLKNKAVLIWPDHDTPGWGYAQSAARACIAAGSASVSILVPPSDKPHKWDAADAVLEGFDCAAFIAQGERHVIKAAASSPAPTLLIPAFTLGSLLDDDSPIPDDLIAPRILTPGGLLVFGGAPKVGKSDFLLAWLTYMAAGAPFLGMIPPRPLQVFYLQAEVQYHYLRERVKGIHLAPEHLELARTNFIATPQLHLILNEAGLAQVIPAMVGAFDGLAPDIIAIDPIRNVFDGGEAGGENDNGAMLFFLSQRIERLRQAVNPEAGVILAHHIKKLGKRQFEEDPFQALAGAGSLRGYYSTGMTLHRPDEGKSLRNIFYELRNGPALDTKYVDKRDGQWFEVDVNERLVHKEYGAKLDAERLRKTDVILQILFEEGLQGRFYTANQFAEAFEGKAGLGGERTIRERLSALATQGYIKYFKNAAHYGLPLIGRSKFGYLCVQGMSMSVDGAVDPLTGELTLVHHQVLPTIYKCPQSGAALPVENPQVWVYPNTINNLEEPA